MKSHKLKLACSIFVGAGCLDAALLKPISAQADVIARTDLATMSISPLVRQPNAPADWRTIYDYSGGQVPVGTRVTAVGKWVAPLVRQDASGVTYVFPPLPAQPQAGQFLRTHFAVEHPLANFPTRVTVKFTLHRNQSNDSPKNRWRALDFTTTDLTSFPLFSVLSSDPVNLNGENTAVLSFDGAGKSDATLNGKPISDSAKRVQLKPAGALLLPGIALSSGMTQLAGDKGDWYSVGAVKIEQLRPALENSATTAIDVDVTGKDAARVSLEVLDATNASQGFILRDALVATGHHRLFWDGIAEKTSQPAGAMPLPRGAYTFRLTTSKVQVQCVGEINNSVPPYNAQSYAQLASTALAITPPGTAAPNRALTSGQDTNRATIRAISIPPIPFNSSASAMIPIMVAGSALTERPSIPKPAMLECKRGAAWRSHHPTLPTPPIRSSSSFIPHPASPVPRPS